MRRIQSILMGVIGALCLISNGYADECPAACPQVEEIKKVGLLMSQKNDEHKLYVVFQFNKYATPQAWGFAMGVPYAQAISRMDAVNKAKAALLTLTGTPVPQAIEGSDGKQWYCLYDNAYSYPAVAITPVNLSSIEAQMMIGFGMKK